MTNVPTQYATPYQREALDTQETKGHTLILTPWTVQNLCLELVANHLLRNDPQQLGYHFSQKYDPDKMKSEIFLDIAYNWDAKVIGQRPAIFVNRGEVKAASPIIAQSIGMNVKESENTKVRLNYMSVGITCIAPNIGFVEELASYIAIPFSNFQIEIQNDFRFRRIRLVDTSAPRLYVESKDNFMVTHTVESVWDERWIVRSDDLKIKTISRVIFDSLVGKPLVNQ